ncbi:IclR family transcriptional regulator [Streptomyces sp. NPDC004609]|uniref:IclR family transcriptional regulator n=1 Tax=Streptomyces sp. NPDC004609 TaxID=3364704 RepID=UPI0036BCFDC5
MASALPQPDGASETSIRQRHPLARAFRILSAMIDSRAESFGVRQLATELSVSASTAHRLLGDLEKLGLVSHAEGGDYRIGLEFYRLAWAATAKFPLRQAAHASLRELARATGESAFLGVYDDLQHQMMFGACVESRHPLRYVMELNRWLPLHSGASGLAILAYLPQDVRGELAASGRLGAVTERTITDPTVLEDVLTDVRRKGYAFSQGQRIRGAVAVTAAVFGPHGGVIGDVGITMPDSRFTPGLETELATAVMEAAKTVTAQVGGISVTTDDQ